MAQYRNPIGQPNPFYTDFPEVIVCRHVRSIAASGEAVREPASQLPRQMRRIKTSEVFTQEVVRAPRERNIPENNTRKIGW